MHVNIDRKSLVTALQACSAIIDAKPSLPILRNVKLLAQNDTLHLHSTNEQISLSLQYPAQVVREGEITTPANHLLALVKAQSVDRVDLIVPESEDDSPSELFIKGGKSKHQLKTMPAENFPLIHNPPHEMMSISASNFLTAIEKVEAAMSDSDARPFMQSICSDNGTLVATDGAKLAQCAFVLPDMLIPKKAIDRIKDFLDGFEQLQLAVTGNRLYLKCADNLMSCHLLDQAQFPSSWRTIFPEGVDRSAIVPKDALMDALKRIALVCGDKGMGVHFRLDKGLLRLESENPELGSGIEEIDVNYDGRSMAIGISCANLRNLIAPWTCQALKFDFQSDDTWPIVIRPEKNEGPVYFGLAMPMRL